MDTTGTRYDDMTFDDMLEQLTREERLKLADERLKAGSGFDYRAAASKMLAARQTQAKTPEEIERITANDNWASHEEQERQRLEGVGRMETAKAVQAQTAQQTDEAGREFAEWDKAHGIDKRNLEAASRGGGYFEQGGYISSPDLKAIGALKHAGGNGVDADYIEKVKDEFSSHYDAMFASDEFQNQDKDFQLKALRHRADMVQALTDAQKGIRLSPEKLSLLEEAGHAYNRFMLGTVRGAAGVGKWIADAFSHSGALEQTPGVHGRTAKNDLQAASEKMGRIAEGAAQAAQTDPSAVESRAAKSETWNLNRAVSLGVSGTLSSAEAMVGTMMLGPAAGLVATIGLPTFGSSYVDIDEDLRRKFPKMSANARFTMATSEAGLKAAIEIGSEYSSELLGLGVIGGVGMKRPAEMFMGDVTKRGARRFFSGVARNMRNMAMGTFAEWMEEAVADPLEDLAQAYRGESEIANALKGKDKGANLMAYAMNSWRDSLLGVATIPLQGAASAGIQAMQKRNNVTNALADPETLKEFGVESEYVCSQLANAMMRAVAGDRQGAENVMQALEKMAADKRHNQDVNGEYVEAARKIFDQVAGTASLGSYELLENVSAKPLPYNGHARVDVMPIGDGGLHLTTASLDDEVIGMALTPSREEAEALKELAVAQWLGAESANIKAVGDGRYAAKLDGRWMMFDEFGHKTGEMSREQSAQMDTQMARQYNKLPREYRLGKSDGNVGVRVGDSAMMNGRSLSVNEWGRTEDNRPQWMVRGSMEDLDWARQNAKGLEFVPGDNESVLLVAGTNPAAALRAASMRESDIRLGGKGFTVMHSKEMEDGVHEWNVYGTPEDLQWLRDQPMDIKLAWNGTSNHAKIVGANPCAKIREAIDPNGEMQEEELDIPMPEAEPEWAARLPGYDHARLVEHLKNLPEEERSAALKFFGDGKTVVFYPGENGEIKAGTRQQCVEESVANGVALRDNGKAGYEFVYRNGLTVPVNKAAYDYASHLRGESQTPQETRKPEKQDKERPKPKSKAQESKTPESQASTEKRAEEQKEQAPAASTASVTPVDVLGAAMDDIRERVESNQATEEEKEELKELEEMAAENQPDETATISAKGRVVRLKTEDIKVDPKRFQFKSGTEADTGVERSNELTGDWDEKTAGNLYVWQDKDGTYYVVNGHHRLDLARRKGVKEVNAMVEREADGVSEEEAKRNGVLINIRDGQGTVEDYARFIHGHKMSEGEARAAGFIRGRSGGKGWQGYLIGAVGSEAMYSEFINGGISAEKAAAVINVANGDEGLEAAAIRLAPTMEADSLAEAVKALKAAPRSKSVQLDLFGFDDSAIKTAEAIGKLVAKRKAALKREIASARGAVKRPDLAGNMDVAVGDDAAGLLKQKAEELSRLEHYDTDHELYQQLLAEATASMEKQKAKPKNEEQKKEEKKQEEPKQEQKAEQPKQEKAKQTEDKPDNEPSSADVGGLHIENADARHEREQRERAAVIAEIMPALESGKSVVLAENTYTTGKTARYMEIKRKYNGDYQASEYGDDIKAEQEQEYVHDWPAKDMREVLDGLLVGHHLHQINDGKAPIKSEPEQDASRQTTEAEIQPTDVKPPEQETPAEDVPPAESSNKVFDKPWLTEEEIRNSGVGDENMILLAIDYINGETNNSVCQAAYAQVKLHVDSQKKENGQEFSPKTDAELRSIVEGDGDTATKRKALREYAAKNGITEKAAQERSEEVLVSIASEVTAMDITPREKFDRLLKLYQNQPVLDMRTSTSIANQAYSTPAPLAFAVANRISLATGKRIYEPTAGNGMLVAGAPHGNTHVNEIDPARLAALHRQGDFAVVTDKDAMQYEPGGTFDREIFNPPFGGLSTPIFTADGYRLSKIDHAIVSKALSALEDDGKAGIIIGANTKNLGGKGNAVNADWVFMNWLYKNFNVKDNFIVDGKLYERQGAGYPVRVITIEGRRETPGGDEEAPREVEKLETWDAVWDKLNTETPAKPSRNQTEEKPGETAEAPKPKQAEETAKPAKKQQAKPRSDTKPAKAEEKKAEPADIDADIENVMGDIMGNLKEFTDATKGKAQMNLLGFNEDQIKAITKLLYNGTRLGFLYIQKGLTKFADWLDAMDKKLRNLFREHGLSDDSIDEFYQDVWNSQYLHDGKRHTLAMWASELGQTREVEAGEQAGDLNVRYNPASNARPLDTVSPKYLADAMAASLNALQERVGNLDQFVMKELGYNSLDELYDKLAGEQVDGVAMIIDAMNRGDGFILGDQTGIGKGRQCAAVMRWAIRHGRIPVFVTEKSNLFTDMYRDGVDVGTEFNPVIFSGSSEGNILNQNKEVVHYAMSSKKRSAAIGELANGGDGYNSVFMTYSQINKPNRQRDELMSLVQSRKCVLVLDEAHNAAGSSQTGEFFLELLRTEDLPVLYASATFAKRPDNMVLYFRTSLRKAVDDIRTLPLAIRLGGVPLQQVVSRQLAEDGLFIRRERDFRGVEFENVCEEPANFGEVLANHDRVVKVLEKIVNFSNAVKDIIKARNDDSRANTREDASIQYAPFASVVHNYINQLLLASKVDLIVERAIKAHQAGEKPVIALTSTIESAIATYMQDKGVQTGDRADMRYADILLAALERMRRASRRNGRGQVQQMELDFDEMGVGGMFASLRNEVESLRDIQYPTSPIDYIRNKLEAAGIKTAEITGRTGGIDYSGKVPVFYSRDAKDKGKNKNINDFNDGVTECLIINQSGATGMSIHASYKFKDQRVRRMIMAQPSLDINVVMQMFGRIMRSGQVVLPKYEILSTPLAAERRPHMILSKKMKSLNANTTANSKGAVDLGVDFMNEIGDGVANDMLLNDMSLALRIGITPVVMRRDDNGNDIGNTSDIARRMSGKMAILSNAEQERLYKELEQRYEDQVELMKAAGEYTLEAEEYDWRATDNPNEKDEEVATGIKDGSVFERPVIVRHLITRDKRRIPSWEAVQNKLAKNFDGKPAEKAISEAIEKAREKIEAIPDTYARLREEGEIGVTSDKASEEQVTSGEVLDELENFIYMNPVDSIYKMTFGEREYNAYLTGFKISPVSERTLYRGSQIFLDFTVDSNVPRVRIPFSQFQNGKCTLERVLFRPEDIFTGQERTFRLPVTLLEGNMVKGFALAERGRIVNYTTEDGAKETGILMPKGWTSKELARDPRLDLNDSNAVMDYLKGTTQGHPANVVSLDGVIHIGAWIDGRGIPSQPDYERFIAVHFAISQKNGRRFIMDRELTSIVGEFSGTKSQNGVFSTRFKVDDTRVEAAIRYLMAEKDVHFRREVSEGQTARYLTGKALENPMEVTSAMKTVNDLKTQYAIPIQLIQDESELPENLQRQLDIDRKRGVFDGGRTWKGIYSGNRVYVNAQAAESKQDLAITVLHEAGVHAGLRALFPNDADFNAFLDEMHGKYGVVKALASRHEQAGLSRRAAIEEAIADMADKYNKNPIWRKILIRIYDSIRNLLAKVGIPVTQLVAIRNIIHDAAMAARRHQDTVESSDGSASYRSGEEADRYEGQYVEVDGERIPFTESADVSNMSHEDIRKMVEDLLEKYKDSGKVYVIQSDGTVVGFARRFPSEYARSKYTRMIERKRDRLWKAKMKGADLVGGMIEIATNRGMEKKSDHHINKFVTYDTQFAIRMGTGEVALFSAKLNLIVEENGEHSLYDVIDINKKGTVPGNQASIVDNDSDGLLQQRRDVRPYGSTNNIDEESGTSSNDALYRTSTGNDGRKWGVIRSRVDVGDGETMEIEMESNNRRKLNYLRQMFKRYLSWGKRRGGVDPAINEAMLQATAQISAEREGASHLLSKWLSAAKSLSREPWAEEVNEAVSRLWNGEFDVSNLSGDIPHYDDPRVTALVELAVEMREETDTLSRRVENIARLNPAVRKAIEDNLGSYHFRAYRIHRDKTYTPSDAARLDAVTSVAAELMSVVRATEDAINQGIDSEYRDLLNQLALSAYVRSGDATVLEGKSKRIRAKARALRRLLERTMKAVNNSFKVVTNLGHVDLQTDAEGINRTANAIVAYLIDKNNDPQYVGHGAAAWRIIQTSFMRRKDLPMWLRTLYGEITDTGMQYEMTTRRLTSIVVMDDMYRKLRSFNDGLDMNDKRRVFYPNKYIRDGIEFVKPLKGAKFGALDGMYTDANTFELLTGYENPTSKFGKFWRGFVSWNRYMHTVENPTTHERNLLGNIAFAMNDGEFLRPAYLKHMIKALRTLTGRGDEASRERQRLMRIGLIGSSAHGVEIFQTVEAMGLKPREFELTELLSRRGYVRRFLSLLFKKIPTAAYAMEDNLFRVAALYAKEARGESTEEAVERIRDLYTTYEMAPAAMTILSKYIPTGKDFLTFPVEAFRCYLNAFKYAKKDLANGSFHSTIGMLGVHAIAIPTVQMLIGKLLALGGDDDDEKRLTGEEFKAMRILLPEYMKNHSIIPWKSGSRIFYYDLGYVYPFDFLPTMFIMAQSDESLAVQAKDIAKDAVFDTFFGGMSAEMLAEQILGRDSRTGRQFTGWTDRMKSIAMGVTPSSWRYLARSIQLAAAEEDQLVTQEGEIRTAGSEFRKSIDPMRKYQKDMAMSYLYKMRSQAMDVRSEKAKANQAWRRAESHEGTRADAESMEREVQRRFDNDIRENIRLLDKAGAVFLTRQQRGKLLRDAGFSMQDTLRILDDKPIQYVRPK